MAAEINTAAAPAVEFRQVDVVFGERSGQARTQALALLDQGLSRADIQAQTQQIIGVANASIAVQPGELCVLMGLSGSGKSTLLRCVNGLNQTARGQVLIGDAQGNTVDVSRARGRVLRRIRRERVSMVFQQFGLLPWRTVADNVGFGLELRGLAKAERQRIVAEQLELVGLADWRDRYVNELSGGMQQRVGLARAFATDADILLMDEPFSALDPLIRDRLQDELCTLQQTLNKTVIFVSHDLDEALKLGNHIAIMDGGRIVQYGEPEHIVLAPKNDYVADFVAHMNPLRVLRGQSLMTPAEQLPRDGREILINNSVRLSIDDNGQPSAASAVADGRALRLLQLRHEQPSSPDQIDSGHTLVAAPADSLLLALLELRHASGLPILLTSADGRLLGVVGDREIYAGILGRARSNKNKVKQSSD